MGFSGLKPCRENTPHIVTSPDLFRVRKEHWSLQTSLSEHHMCLSACRERSTSSDCMALFHCLFAFYLFTCFKDFRDCGRIIYASCMLNHCKKTWVCAMHTSCCRIIWANILKQGGSRRKCVGWVKCRGHRSCCLRFIFILSVGRFECMVLCSLYLLLKHFIQTFSSDISETIIQAYFNCCEFSYFIIIQGMFTLAF